MKYFVVETETRDGEREYTDHFIVKAENIKEAEIKAKKHLLENYGANPEDWDEEARQVDLFETIVRLGMVEEVSKRDYMALKRYFWVTD